MKKENKEDKDDLKKTKSRNGIGHFAVSWGILEVTSRDLEQKPDTEFILNLNTMF